VKNNKINCTEFERLEMKLLDNELTDAEKSKMLEHTRICEKCARELELYKGIKEDLSALPVPRVGADFTDNVMSAVCALPKTGRSKGLALAAMCAVLGAVSSVAGLLSLIMLNSGALAEVLYKTPQLTRLLTALSQANGNAETLLSGAAGIVGAYTDSIAFAVIAAVMIAAGIYSTLNPFGKHLFNGKR
jgi:anti-sigma factor RsiW